MTARLPPRRDGTGAIDAGVEAIVGAKLGEEGASVRSFVVEVGAKSLSAFSE